MERYRKVAVRIWADREVRRLSRAQPNGQTLFVYLLTAAETAIIPGAFRAREGGLAEELGWAPEGFRKAFAEVSGEAHASGLAVGAHKPLAKADWEAGFVWVPNAIKHNAPQSPNVIRSWRSAWVELPECDLKDEAYQRLRAFIEGMGEAFLKAFDEAIQDPSPKTMANQDQDQEQEQDQEQDSERACGSGLILAEQSRTSAVAPPAAIAPPAPVKPAPLPAAPPAAPPAMTWPTAPGVVVGRRFNSNDLGAIWSSSRKQVGLGSARIDKSDYTRAQDACEIAIEECPEDPGGWCERGIRHYLANASGFERDKGLPFWGWAKDPSRWALYDPEAAVSEDEDERLLRVRNLRRDLESARMVCEMTDDEAERNIYLRKSEKIKKELERYGATQ